MPKKTDDGGRVVLPQTTIHPETMKAIRAIKSEKRVPLGVAIDEIYWRWKQTVEAGKV